ncbi:hypothetical protein BCE_0876 [Bacillus cereus ATCC 10987]|uniref:Uncharacterized protein n=1 Tax=Bacillus cereus (strain ATCC 10987 / NRS 248) TaxID=222523 RepID=Q73D38_BACC1|nr:hypothetical protein BCE_0876 [Bacillus cereus ATCC 10987]
MTKKNITKHLHFVKIQFIYKKSDFLYFIFEM